MKHMPLFERSTLPIGKRAKLYGEAIYSYYRNSERPGIIAIRTLLEQWFLEIPEGERQDLQQRFRSPIERQHRSAVFELFLHHFLLRCGFQVEFHPDIPGVATHPDFLVSRDGRAHFYLEAIAVSNSVEDEAAINRMNRTRVRTAIRRMRTALDASDSAGAEKHASATFSELDKAIRKRTLSENTANRYKSRLTLALNALKAKK